MKTKPKRILILVIVLLMSILLVSCNKQLIDTTYRYSRAILRLPDGTVIDGAVESWTDYEDGDQIQVVIDGVPYLVHSSNVALMCE